VLGSKDRTSFNGAIYVLARVIKNIMASAMEAEVSALYENAQKIMEFWQTLEDMEQTLIRTDNKTACGIVNGTMKQKRSKSMDMRWHWLKDRVNNHKQLDIQWAPGVTNFGDYPSKHHPGSHHRQVRPVFLHVKGLSPTTIQGCIRILKGE